MARCQGLANLQQVTNMVTIGDHGGPLVALVTMVTMTPSGLDGLGGQTH